MVKPTMGSLESAQPQLGTELAFLEQALWQRLHEAKSTEELAAAWLTLQCSMLPGVTAGLVVLGAPEVGPYAPVASWPDGKITSTTLAAVCESALAARKGVVNPASEGSCAAYPIQIEGQLLGVVAVNVVGADEVTLRSVMRKLQWGCGRLEANLLRQAATPGTMAASDARLAIELAATALEAERFQEAATALVTELATQLGCDRVSLGFREGKHSQVIAISHSADFGKQSNLTRAVGMAMDEAIDQQCSVIYPQTTGQKVNVDRAHAELAVLGGGLHIYTVPLMDKGVRYGAITLDTARSQGLTPELVATVGRITAFIGPVLANLHREDRWIGHKVYLSFRTQVARLLGANYVGRKLVAVSLVGLITFMFLAMDVYRIPAAATLEGSIERVAVAPIAGYIAESKVRAGDTVAKGDLLFRIDDRDLRLEYLKWSSQKEQIDRKLRDALAQHERSEVNILRAQLDQAKAQLSIVGEQIERTRVIAPFDGIVVAGDLSDQLGAPVERGQILFEVAPLNSYRVALQVSENEISQVKIGQSGQLVLASKSNLVIPIWVDAITPVSTAADGTNTFRVDAQLLERPDFLRPGMQGSARINVEPRRLVWIWTHDMVDWLRLWVWSWWP
ncbi:MAG: HlyD family efflux transporter periplasmic adaptor subunit [Motiliproteus sp.]